MDHLSPPLSKRSQTSSPSNTMNARDVSPNGLGSGSGSSHSSQTPPVIPLASGISDDDLGRLLQPNFSSHTLSPMVPAPDVLLPTHVDRNGGGIDYELLSRISTELTEETKISDVIARPTGSGAKTNPFLSHSPDSLLQHQIQAAFKFGDAVEFDRFTFYSENLGTFRSSSLKGFAAKGIDVSDAMRSGGTFWLDVTAPTAEDLSLLGGVFKIHPLTVEDILTEEIREKCELFKNYYFVSIRTVIRETFGQGGIRPQNMYQLVFKNGILSFHSNPIPHIDNVLKRIQHLKDFISLNSDWINYALIDDVIDSFAPVLRQCEIEVDTIDELVLILKESEQTDMLRRIGHSRKRVTTLLRLLSTKPDVIKALTLRSEDRIPSSAKSDIKLYLGDIQDHVITMVQNCLHYEKVLARAHSNYLAQISIELTQVSNRTNDVVAKLTVMASILLPMNVITGMWGMNVRVPGENVENLDWFFGICGCMLVLALSFLFIVRKYGFI